MKRISAFIAIAALAAGLAAGPASANGPKAKVKDPIKVQVHL